jgi:hypothetical protein
MEKRNLSDRMNPDPKGHFGTAGLLTRLLSLALKTSREGELLNLKYQFSHTTKGKQIIIALVQKSAKTKVERGRMRGVCFLMFKSSENCKAKGWQVRAKEVLEWGTGRFQRP